MNFIDVTAYLKTFEMFALSETWVQILNKIDNILIPEYDVSFLFFFFFFQQIKLYYTEEP